MKDPRIAAIVAGALRRRDGDVYGVTGETFLLESTSQESGLPNEARACAAVAQAVQLVPSTKARV
ncbi:MAG: hypothetical protein ACKVX9_22915 [Blastocatellia bacterium]